MVEEQQTGRRHGRRMVLTHQALVRGAAVHDELGSQDADADTWSTGLPWELATAAAEYLELAAELAPDGELYDELRSVQWAAQDAARKLPTPPPERVNPMVQMVKDGRLPEPTGAAGRFPDLTPE